MTDQESLDAAIHEHVELVTYDVDWPRMFEAERTRLLSLFPNDFIEIEHFGSTAIPCMSAKPIIDILGGVKTLASAGKLSTGLCEIGYATSAEFNAARSGQKWFMRRAAGRRTHHLHVVVHGGEVWCERLTFRDRLRADAETAARYESLKASLATKHWDDREAYTSAKADFVRLFSS